MILLVHKFENVNEIGGGDGDSDDSDDDDDYDDC